MAHKKGLGSSRNGRDSNAQRLGVKVVRRPGRDRRRDHRAPARQPLQGGRRRRHGQGRHALRPRRGHGALLGRPPRPRRLDRSAGVAARPPGRARSARRAAFAPTMSTMLYDKARIHVQAGRGGDGSRELPPRGARPARRARRRRRRAGGDVVVDCDASLRDLQAFRRRTHFRAHAGGDGGASQRHGATATPLIVRVPPGTQVRDRGRRRCTTSCAPGQRALARARRLRRPRQQAFRDVDAPGARASPSAAWPGEERWLELDAEAARRRRPRRPAERRQVLAARAAHARRAEDRRLPVHDARAGARDARGRRAPARHRRHPRA